MSDKLNLTEKAGVEVVKGGSHGNSCGPKGRYVMQHLRGGEVIATVEGHNAVTNEGKDKLFDVMFGGDTAIAAADYNMLLINNSPAPAPAVSNTYAGIVGDSNGWDEFTSYTNGSGATERGPWVAGASADGVITNPSQVVFNITGTGTIYGLGVVGGSNSEGHADNTAGNILWATAAFDQGATAVQSGDQLKITYTVSA